MDTINKPKYIEAGDMSADINGAGLSTAHMANIAVRSDWTGVPVGDLQFEGSMDGVTWFSVSADVAAGGAPGVEDTLLADYGYPFFRVIFDFTSGTGSLDVGVFAKGFI